MKPILTLLQLDRIFVRKLVVRANEDYKPRKNGKEPEDVIDVDFDVLVNPDNYLNQAVTLTLSVNAGSSAFRTRKRQIEIDVAAFFHFDEMEEYETGKYDLNMIAMTYSEVRAIVRTATSSLPYGACNIPVVNIAAMQKMKLNHMSAKGGTNR